MYLFLQSSLVAERHARSEESRSAIQFSKDPEGGDTEFPEEGDQGDELEAEFDLLGEGDEVVESAARHRQEIGMSPSAITVITREDIETSGVTSISDLLRMVPGVEIIAISPFWPSVGGRLVWGPVNGYHLVLVDGRDATFELAGQTIFELQPVFVEDIERIEVIRGPGSSLYGANAVSGVVSITTRGSSESSSGFVHLTGGQPGYASGGIRGNLQLGDFGFSISGGALHQGDFLDPRELAEEGWKFRAAGEYRLHGSKRLLLDLGLSQGFGYVSTGNGTGKGNLSQRYVRAAFEGQEIRALVYWQQHASTAELAAPLYFKGVHMADFARATFNGDSVAGEVQWTLPKLVDPLLLMLGAAGRYSQIGSDQFLDAESYANPEDPRYHQPGLLYQEWHASSFVHCEYSPSSWVTLTGGIRLDYTSVTGFFPSPRLAAVFKPADGHFIRMGVARAFRKPSFMESHLHLMAEFPKESPLTGNQQYKFEEFLTRVIGNDQVDNEELISAELGYLGNFFNERLTIAWDLYYNYFHGGIAMMTKINVNPSLPNIPDLETSSAQAGNYWPDIHIVGSELTANWDISKSWSVLASWSHREVFNDALEGIIRQNNASPKEYFTLGARFHQDTGLIGSLFGFLRSEMWASDVENPEGLLEPRLVVYSNAVILFIGRLGWKWKWAEHLELEAGAKLFLPISPFSDRPFQYNERGGGFTANGNKYGGDELERMVLFYLQGSTF